MSKTSKMLRNRLQLGYPHVPAFIDPKGKNGEFTHCLTVALTEEEAAIVNDMVEGAEGNSIGRVMRSLIRSAIPSEVLANIAETVKANRANGIEHGQALRDEEEAEILHRAKMKQIKLEAEKPKPAQPKPRRVFIP